MQSSITFSGDPDLIAQIAITVNDLQKDWYGDLDGQENAGNSTPEQHAFLAANGATTVPPTSEPVKTTKKRESAAEKKARLEAEALAAAPAVEPNAAANAAIQQQSQWAQQTPQTPGFPAAAAPVTPAQPAPFPASQPAPFPASQPAQPHVDTTGQPWLAPQAVNAPAGPTLEALYQLLNGGLTADNKKRELFTNWMFFKGISDISVIQGQHELIAEAYGIAQKIISGEIQPVA